MARISRVMKEIREEYSRQRRKIGAHSIEPHKVYKGPSWGNAYERSYFVRMAIHGTVTAALALSGHSTQWLKQKRELHGEKWYEEEEFAKSLYHACDMGILDDLIYGADGTVDRELLMFKMKYLHPEFKAKSQVSGDDGSPIVVKFHPAEFGQKAENEENG